MRRSLGGRRTWVQILPRSCYYVVFSLTGTVSTYAKHCGLFLILLFCDVSSCGTEAWNGHYRTLACQSHMAHASFRLWPLSL